MAPINTVFPYGLFRFWGFRGRFHVLAMEMKKKGVISLTHFNVSGNGNVQEINV